MTHFIGRPSVEIGGAGPYELATTDRLRTVENVPGVATPHNMISGTNWLQLPTADGVQTMPMNSYGQWQRGAAQPSVGDWVEWYFGAIKSEPSPTDSAVHMWACVGIGPNLGRYQVSWNGVNIGVIDTYATGYATVGTYAGPFDPVFGGQFVPKGKNRLRFTVMTPNASSTGNYLLLYEIGIYAVG